jgi:hypothetical protein
LPLAPYSLVSPDFWQTYVKLQLEYVLKMLCSKSKPLELETRIDHILMVGTPGRTASTTGSRQLLLDIFTYS